MAKLQPTAETIMVNLMEQHLNKVMETAVHPTAEVNKAMDQLLNKVMATVVHLMEEANKDMAATMVHLMENLRMKSQNATNMPLQMPCD